MLEIYCSLNFSTELVCILFLSTKVLLSLLPLFFVFICLFHVQFLMFFTGLSVFRFSVLLCLSLFFFCFSLVYQFFFLFFCSPFFTICFFIFTISFFFPLCFIFSLGKTIVEISLNALLREINENIGISLSRYELLINREEKLTTYVNIEIPIGDTVNEVVHY